MLLNKKIKSSSLLITLIIAIIIGILCSALILISYYNRILDINSQNEDKLNRNLQSAINLILADTTYDIKNTKGVFDLFEEGNDTVEILKTNWGLFRTATAKAFAKGQTKKSQFIIGVEIPTYMRGCIYLADKQRPLALVGDVKLFGDAFLPKAGLKTAYIDQSGFSYKEMINGVVTKSENQLPQLDSQILNNVKNYFETIKNPSNDILSIKNIGDSLVNSFNDNTVYFYDIKKISLSQKNLKGKIVITSKEEVDIDSSTILANVILVAPIINIKKGFKGSIQAFATRKINIEEDCELEYPSCIVLLNELGNTEQSKLKISSGVKISGTLLGINLNSVVPNNIFFEFEQNVRITGVVYVDGFISLQGIVYGTVLTNFFIYKSPKAIYENYLVDAEVNRFKLSSYFLVSPIFNKKGKNYVAEWLE